MTGIVANGGNGDDIIVGSDGNDTLNGGNGKDTINGAAGDDQIVGGNGDDTLTGGDGDDTLNGGNHIDTLNGGTGDDALLGGNHDDMLNGGSGNDWLSGGNHMDTLIGGAGEDSLFGGNHDDTLIGGRGDDILDGGLGDDLFVFAPGGNGAEFSVNTTTAGAQRTTGTEHSVAGLSDGGFVVVWRGNGVGDNLGVFGQKYAADGAAIGAEVLINSNTAGAHDEATVTAVPGGGFIVAWSTDAQDGSGQGVYGQRFEEDWTPIGSEFRINATTANDQSGPVIAVLNDGSHVAVWVSFGQGDTNLAIFGQRYASDGTLAGGEFQINTPGFESDGATVEALADGGFVAVWTSFDQDGSRSGIFGQRYDKDGNAEPGGAFQINTTTSLDQFAATITALESGGFVVTWASDGQDSDGSRGIYGQRFAANGAAEGGEFQINTTAAGDQFRPSITGLADGSFVVVWQSPGQDGSGLGIYGQQFAANGTQIGGEFLVNQETANDQFQPSVSSLADGGFVVSWTSDGQDGSDLGVFARFY